MISAFAHNQAIHQAPLEFCSLLCLWARDRVLLFRLSCWLVTHILHAYSSFSSDETLVWVPSDKGAVRDGCLKIPIQLYSRYRAQSVNDRSLFDICSPCFVAVYPGLLLHPCAVLAHVHQVSASTPTHTCQPVRLRILAFCFMKFEKSQLKTPAPYSHSSVIFVLSSASSNPVSHGKTLENH